jgi:hypothetical protein
VTADPPVKADGTCYVCGKPRRVPKGAWARAAAELDSFCSTECCRQWHGVSLRATPSTSNPSRVSLVMHGTERGYNTDGCRCDSCTWAATTARRKRRARQEQERAA